MQTVHKGEFMKSFLTLALFIGLTGMTSISHASGKFCMKKFLASMTLEPNPATNAYAQSGKNSNGSGSEATASSVGKRQ